LENTPYEAHAIQWGLGYLDDIVQRFRPRVILCLGGVSFRAVTGLSGILEARGYPVPSRYEGIPALGALHPAFLRRGAMGYLSALMHDIRFAVALAAASAIATRTGVSQQHSLGKLQDGVHGSSKVEFWSPVLWRQVSYSIPLPLAPLNEPIVPPDYVLYPTEDVAKDFLSDAQRDPSVLIAYDIETLRAKKGEEKSDEPDDQPDPIESIQFSLAPGTGIFLPWRPPFLDIALAILALPNPKIGCNNWRFDDPRLLQEGAKINGQRHDLRWAWKHLQPDLSAALQAIASYYAPDFSPWKHLSESHKEFYGIRDCDACLRCV
jgi:hypothetical protein